MTARYSWWYEQLSGRTWVIYAACGFVALLVAPYWLAFAHQGPPDGVATRTATVRSVADPDEKDKTVTVAVEGQTRPQTVNLTGDAKAGDRLEVWRSDGVWHTGREYSLTGGLVMTTAIWLITGGTAYAVHRRASRRPRRPHAGRPLAGARRG